MLPLSQADDHFSGFLSGFQTTMLLNSKRLYIKIQIPSRQIIYQSTIQYDPTDPIYLQVKKVFTNLHLLFDYINEYSQDIERIRVNLNELKIKIVKNQGPRRLKKSPHLYIPLKKIFVYEKKQQTKLHIDVQTAISHNTILRCKFQYQKSQRNRILNQYNLLNDQICRLIKSNGLDLSLLQPQWSQVNDLFLNENNHAQREIYRNNQEKPLFEEELDKILMENGEKTQRHAQESLFFEDESVHNSVPQSLHQTRLSPKLNLQDKNYDSNRLDFEQKSFTSDPFSYLF